MRSSIISFQTEGEFNRSRGWLFAHQNYIEGGGKPNKLHRRLSPKLVYS